MPFTLFEAHAVLSDVPLQKSTTQKRLSAACGKPRRSGTENTIPLEKRKDRLNDMQAKRNRFKSN